MTIVQLQIPRSPHLPNTRADVLPLTKSCTCPDHCFCAVNRCNWYQCNCVIPHGQNFCSNECAVDRHCDDIKAQAEAIPKVQEAYKEYLERGDSRKPITFIDFPPPASFRYGYFDSDNCCWEYVNNPIQPSYWEEP